jgi:transposase
MQSVTTIGLDIAKSVFQVHGVDAAGQVAVRRQLKRRAVLAFFQNLPPCLVGIEERTSAHRKCLLMPPSAAHMTSSVEPSLFDRITCPESSGAT